jgi:glutamate-ammonia-ligase adenylyltransferase
VTAPSLTDLAKAGFANLSESRALVDELAREHGVPVDVLLESVVDTADPDRSVIELERLCRSGSTMSHLVPFMAKPESFSRLLRVLGGSAGLATFLQRHPTSLAILLSDNGLPTADALRDSLLKSVSVRAGVARRSGEQARTALRVRYREQLLGIASCDLSTDDPVALVDSIARALAHLADAALEAALAVARADIVDGTITEADVALVRFAIIGMGKCGALELNYVSDVDVIFVAESSDEDSLSTERALTIATKLAQHVMRIVFEAGPEPGLWEVDANLRPEGKAGALVRTLDSHRAYYERWAKNWEFQALLKARPVAGDQELGQRYVETLAPFVWRSASRPEFVEQVQAMRERVTAHIPADDVDFQIKLGPGGLRDVEFTVQLLQLVHGQTDESVRSRGTLESLAALAERGYVGRPEASSFGQNYRVLRTLEHRIQLRDLSRTHLMPRSEEAVRAIARGSRLASTSTELLDFWQRVKHEVRNLHERLFYRPLLAAVATLPDEAIAITSEQAESRLAAIGFRDPRTALTHIAALTTGLRRRSDIQRALLPVLLKWLAEGPNPDAGLLTFRRISEKLGDSPWFLRMLRDSSGAASRLMTILSGSHYVADLIERIPEAVAWLDDDADLVPRDIDSVSSEIDAVVERHDGDEGASEARKAIHSIRHRENLRIAMGSILGVNSDALTSSGLSSVMEATLDGALRLASRDESINPEMAIVAMGRFGGQETGFGSDADVMFVYRDTSVISGNEATRRAERIVARVKEILEDQRLPFDLDTDLRPEGKNGVVVRSLESYAAYYTRWSLSWEAQALLRARPAIGELSLLSDFAAVIEPVRYPAAITDEDLREIRRIKARVEKERLPQGADPARHLKLGRGSLSDIEWLVQLLQLQHAHAHPELKTTSTKIAMSAAVDASLVSRTDADVLMAAWEIASRIRSACTLWGVSTSDMLPLDRGDLDGIARLLGYPPNSAARLEEDYLSATRRARSTFERLFFGV